MRIAGLVVLCGLVLGTASAEAGWFGVGSKQPKPISVLEINRSWEPSHAVVHVRSNKYEKTGWGAQWKQIFRNAHHVNHHSIRGN